MGCLELLFNSTCFCACIVWAVRFLCMKKQSLGVAYMWYLCICMHRPRSSSADLPLQDVPYVHAGPCMLWDLSLCIQTNTWLQDLNPRGSTSIQNRKIRKQRYEQTCSELLPTTTKAWCCEGPMQHHNGKVSRGQKECTGPLPETPLHLHSPPIFPPFLPAWHLS